MWTMVTPPTVVDVMPARLSREYLGLGSSDDDGLGGHYYAHCFTLIDGVLFMSFALSLASPLFSNYTSLLLGRGGSRGIMIY